jgi:hypothetical protein
LSENTDWEEARTRQAAITVDLVETLSSDYEAISEDMVSLLQRMATVTMGATVFLLALYLVYWAYAAPIFKSAGLDVGVTAAMLTLLLIFFLTYLRIRRSRGDIWLLDSDIEELVETHEETVIQAERVEAGMSENEQITLILRKANPSLDEALNESPGLLRLDSEVKGRKAALKATVFVGVPWKSSWEKFNHEALNSNLKNMWIAINYEGSQPMSLEDIRPIQQKLKDILQFLRPRDAQAYVFSRQGFSPEAVEFAEKEDNWISYWREGTDEEQVLVLDLIKIADGNFSVVSMPYLKSLREERLAVPAE